MHERRLCEDRGSDWSDAFASQGMPRLASNNQKLGRSNGTDFPPEHPEETSPAYMLILDFWTSEE